MPATPCYAVLDLETTGLDPDAGDRIVEVAVVRCDARGRAVDVWSTLVDPEGRRGAEHVHGLAPGQLRGAPRFADAAPVLVRRLAGCTLVAHHAAFDVEFLAAELARAGHPAPRLDAICTVRAAQAARLPRPWSQAVLAARLGLDPGEGVAHRALADAHVTARLWQHLLAQGACAESLVRAPRELAIDWDVAA